MSNSHTRRSFVKTSAATAAWATGSYFASQSPAQETKSTGATLTVAIMGVNGRGSALANAFIGQPNCQVAYICDVDERAINKVMSAIAAKQNRKPQGIADFRKALDDKSLDALVCAAPNHWHAPATILGCAAGKHVYVEKPCSHTAREGELAIEAARKHNRVVQMGSQRRSWPNMIEAVGKLREGAIGKLHYARSWYNNTRQSIGVGKPAAVPAWLDWSLWQGPAPERPFVDNVVHYNWHWKWHWGNGELGNNGVHALDLARWGLGVDFPIRVTSSGGKYRHDDDQETPDTHVVSYNFPGNKTITWEGLSWSPYGNGGSQFGISFHGSEGTLVFEDRGYRIFDLKNKEVVATKNDDDERGHIANFLDCIRTGKRPAADIAEAHKSTLLCHLGNIAHRTGRVLTTSEKDGHIVGDEQAMQLWSREYRPGWEPKV
ncbi:MAG: Gfo/Idh/MocA family oxidoreductase [Planctomycetaceae bacterium]|nr:Gfo/Idh/MocA family oxidoreductase [Planctomycetaceae bacterium]